MTENLQWLVTAAAILAAVISIYKYFSQVVKFVERQKKQDEEIRSIKNEQTIIIYGLLACLKGLAEQGCNGPVHDGIEKIEKHLNLKAHE